MWGKYDAKEGFMPGGASLHSCMTPHGPDAETYRKASDTSIEQKPVYFDQVISSELYSSYLDIFPYRLTHSGSMNIKGLAFMFECNAMLNVADWALESEAREETYWTCWQDMPKEYSADGLC